MDFYGQVTEPYRTQFEGRCADLFFENKGRIIHKWPHYFQVYDEVMAPYIGTEVRMLEIGVFRGGSLELWRRLLGEKAIIFGIDIDPQCRQYDDSNASVRIGSQDDPVFLKETVSEMGGLDIVLDDGSHVAKHQRASYETLFPLLSDGGIYIIEDMHTAYWPAFDGGLRRKGTAIEFLKQKVDQMHRHYYEKDSNSTEAIPPIESIQFFDSIAVVKKRRQLPRYHVKVPNV